jgi:hypothetical protein
MTGVKFPFLPSIVAVSETATIDGKKGNLTPVQTEEAAACCLGGAAL